MADLGNLTNLVAQLTNRLNDIETNAKKIDELPPKSEITLSDKLHISDNGVSKYTTMGDVINSIQARDYDHLVSVESVTNVGNDVIITNAVAEINGNNVTNGTPVTLFVPYAATGYHRIDHILIDANGRIYLYQGNETTGIAIEPAYVLGTVLITALDVSDNSLITGEPVIGDDFIKRSEQFFIQANIINGIINLSSITESGKRYTNIKVMGGNNLSKVTYNFAYEGMRSLIWNGTNANIQIVSGQTFIQNVTITPNQIIEFIYSGGKLYLEGGVGGATEKRTFTKEGTWSVTNANPGIYTSLNNGSATNYSQSTTYSNPSQLIGYNGGYWQFNFPKTVRLAKISCESAVVGGYSFAIVKGTSFIHSEPSGKALLYNKDTSMQSFIEEPNNVIINAGEYIKIFFKNPVSVGNNGHFILTFEEI